MSGAGLLVQAHRRVAPPLQSSDVLPRSLTPVSSLTRCGDSASRDSSSWGDISFAPCRGEVEARSRRGRGEVERDGRDVMRREATDAGFSPRKRPRGGHFLLTVGTEPGTRGGRLPSREYGESSP